MNYRVVIARGVDGNWVLTAFDFKTPKKDKKKGTPAVVTPGETAVAEEAGAVASNLSLPKDSETSVTRKETAEEDDGEDSMCVIVAEKMVCRVYVGRRRVRWASWVGEKVRAKRRLRRVAGG